MQRKEDKIMGQIANRMLIEMIYKLKEKIDKNSLDGKDTVESEKMTTENIQENSEDHLVRHED